MRVLILSLLLCSSAALAEPPQASPTDTPPSAGEAPGFIGRVGERLTNQLQLARDTVGDTASDLVAHAMGFLGVPYRRGGNSAETGFDCSGFVRNVYEQTVGLVLPRRANEQAQATQTIDREDLQPGDLVFFNTLRRTFSHVGIYVGEGRFVHAPRPGGEVRIENMRYAYWAKRFTGARRAALLAQAPEASAGTTATP